MALKLLSVVNSAYRGTNEEQDDTILWVSTALKGAGANISVLLRGNAVCYGVKGQDASGLRFGAETQSQPPNIEADVARLIGKGVEVFIIEDDMASRGIEPGQLVDGLRPIALNGLPKLMDDFDQIWNW